MVAKSNELPDWDSLRFAFRPTDAFYRSIGRIEQDPAWDAGEFLPFGPVELSPAAAFFSYGLGVFEGLKAQRSPDGRLLLFRHRDNAARLGLSAQRLLLPPFPEDRFVAAVEELVARNARFVPPFGRGTFYIRPVQHAIDPLIGISAGSSFWVLMFGCPVGGYFAGKSVGAEAGLRLRVLEQGRVAPGGTGAVKAIGNYAGGMALARPWQQEGFNDVLYLDSRRLRFITETSGSNVFVKLKSGRLVTPALDDQILAGITRDSVIRLARQGFGVEVEERAVSLEEALDDGEELFCTGTAWTVLSVREIDHRGKIHRFECHELQRTLRAELRRIQSGEAEDRYGWVTEVES